MVSSSLPSMIIIIIIMIIIIMIMIIITTTTTTIIIIIILIMNIAPGGSQRWLRAAHQALLGPARQAVHPGAVLQ